MWVANPPASAKQNPALVQGFFMIVNEKFEQHHSKAAAFPFSHTESNTAHIFHFPITMKSTNCRFDSVPP
jgi:hypothetical protein